MPDGKQDKKDGNSSSQQGKSGETADQNGQSNIKFGEFLVKGSGVRGDNKKNKNKNKGGDKN